MDDDFETKKDNRILDGLHYYLCSRDYNLSFDETTENLNLNVEGDSENNAADVANAIPAEDDTATADSTKQQQQQQQQTQQQPQQPATGVAYTNLAMIPTSFNDAEDYVKTFEAHLFTEAKAQIQKAQVSESKPPDQMRIVSSSVSRLVADSELFFRKFVLDKISISETRYFTHDFVVMSLADPSVTKKISGEHMLGVVERSEGATVTIKVVFDEKGLDERNKSLTKIFSSDNEDLWRMWYVQKFCSIVTIQREYEALQGFHALQIKEFILNPEQLNLMREEKFVIPGLLESQLSKIYNRSQFEAISSTLKKKGVTLIQGPPGTGKTRTVLGTVSVLINSFNKEHSTSQSKHGTSGGSSKQSASYLRTGVFNYEKAMPWLQPNYVDWRDSTFDHLHDDFSNFQKTKRYIQADSTDFVIPLKHKEEEHAPPEKILICGPSNAAIDEIVRKMKKDGLLDKSGNQYDPSSIIVRIGENFDKELEDVSLEYLVKQKLGELNLRSDDSGEIRKKILKEAKIICGTLSSTGSMLLAASNFVFDTVVIDEAAQSTEISTLIPLQYQCSRLVLIGDHNQLPATIFSKKCEKYNYTQSLFERFQKSGVKVHMLDQQYRMNPTISKFISDTFYEGKISDADKIKEFIGEPEMYQLRLFQPMLFLNVQGNEIFEGASYKNVEEASAIVEIYAKLKNTFPSFDVSKLGIITAYSRQVKEIKRQIKTFDQSEKCAVEVHTVDGFQGREKDVIIFSTVRASEQNGKKATKKTIGFLNDRRRMNVSLSRARLAVIVVGDLKQLRYSKLWKSLAEYTISKDCCFNMEKPFSKFVDRIELHAGEYKVYRTS